MRLVAGSLVYLMAVCAQAALVTIDFEEIDMAEDGLEPILEDVTSKGYTIDYFTQDTGNPAFANGTPSINGTILYTSCGDCRSPEIMDVYETLGGTLRLMSIDIGTFTDGAERHEFRFIGTKSGGGTINKTVFSTGGVMTTVNFDGSWFNLDSFRIEISPDPGTPLSAFTYSAFDNIVINTVPIPAAAS